MNRSVQIGLGLAATVATALGAVWGFTKTDGGTTEVARSIAPMEHWMHPQELVHKQAPIRILTNMRTAIGYDDPDMARSVEHFPEYVNAIAGYDVAALAEADPPSAYYACAAAGEDGPNAWCSARFGIQHSGRNYDVIVEVGDRGYSETRKPAEVIVVHGES